MEERSPIELEKALHPILQSEEPSRNENQVIQHLMCTVPARSHSKEELNRNLWAQIKKVLSDTQELHLRVPIDN